jgi:hypothetical protein
MWPVYKFWRIWAFLLAFPSYDSPNNLPLWDLIKTFYLTGEPLIIENFISAKTKSSVFAACKESSFEIIYIN